MPGTVRIGGGVMMKQERYEPQSAYNPKPTQKDWMKPVVLGGVKSESELKLEKKKFGRQ